MVLECEVNGAATLLSRARPHPAGHHLTKAQKPLHRTWSTWRTARFIVMLPCLMQT